MRQRQNLALCSHKPRNTWGHWKLEEAGGTVLQSLQRDPNIANILIPGIQPPELRG